VHLFYDQSDEEHRVYVTAADLLKKFKSQIIEVQDSELK
jgi:hypothetical protein